MLTVELLNVATGFAESLGYGIRHEWLGGATGGVCEVHGKRWLFIDLALNPLEQLDQVVQALQQDARIYAADVPAPIRELLGVSRAA